MTVWDIATQKQVGATITQDQMVDADISPDGRFVVTAQGTDEGTALLWDIDSGKRMGAKMAHKGRIISVRYSPDGHYLVTASLDRTCCVWNALTGSLVSRYTSPRNDDGLVAAEFDNASRTVAALCHNGQMTRWDPSTGHVLMSMNAGTGGYEMAHGGPFVAVAGVHPYMYSHAGSVWGAAQVFDISSGKSISGLLKHEIQPVPSETKGGMLICFSHNNRYLATACRMGNSVRVWDIKNGGALVVMPIEHLQPISSVAFDPAAQYLVTACTDGAIRVWHLP